jgi:hypothetical protein
MNIHPQNSRKIQAGLNARSPELYKVSFVEM